MSKNHINYSEDYIGKIFDSGKKPQNRIMVGIPMTGLLRAEWVVARYGQVIPCNWGQADMLQFLDSWQPVNYSVADARNIIANAAIDLDYEWLFFIDHDTILPNTTVLKMNERMLQGNVPIWSGVYFTKSVPSEPLIYRGAGTGYYRDWKFGDDVWTSGVPMGCTMINVNILRALKEAVDSEGKPVCPLYTTATGQTIRQIFETPAIYYLDPASETHGVVTGTEDLHFCSKIVKNKIFEKAGFPEYEDMEFPFLVDTSIFCRHIDFDGVQYPRNGEEYQFVPKEWLNINTKEQFIRSLKDRFNMLPEPDPLVSRSEKCPV